MFFAVWKIAFESQFGRNDLIDKKTLVGIHKLVWMEN